VGDSKGKESCDWDGRGGDWGEGATRKPSVRFGIGFVSQKPLYLPGSYITEGRPHRLDKPLTPPSSQSMRLPSYQGSTGRKNNRKRKGGTHWTGQKSWE